MNYHPPFIKTHHASIYVNRQDRKNLRLTYRDLRHANIDVETARGVITKLCGLKGVLGLNACNASLQRNATPKAP